MDLPEPRVALGRGLLNTATACCDISDGLIGDLKHILERSGVSARLFWPAFPESDAMKQLPEAVQQRCVLSGGDDYELLFTAPATVGTKFCGSPNGLTRACLVSEKCSLRESLFRLLMKRARMSIALPPLIISEKLAHEVI
mgnify:CR=1 FL=1